MSAPGHPCARTPLGRLYLQHAILAGAALNEAHERLEIKKEAPTSDRLNELARIANRQSAMCAAIVGTAHVLLDGDGFETFCRDAGIDARERDEALTLTFSNLPPLTS